MFCSFPLLHAIWTGIMTLLTLLWNVPKLAAISVVLSLYWPSSCDSPLGSWALVEGIRILFALIITLSVYYGVLDEDGNQRNSPVRWLLLKCYSSLRSLHFVWYAVGVYWVLSSTTCSSDAVAIYHLCLALIVVDTIDFMKNFLALVCLLPVALLCLPCGMYIVYAFPNNYVMDISFYVW